MRTRSLHPNHRLPAPPLLRFRTRPEGAAVLLVFALVWFVLAGLLVG